MNWKYHNLPISHETFNLIKKSASNYPFQPEHRKFNDIMFYHYTETNKTSASEISSKWKSLGYRIRTTKTRTRAIRGVKHGSWISGSTYYHVWIGEK